jgi:LPS export ABC transporter protein LptC
MNDKKLIIIGLLVCLMAGLFLSVHARNLFSPLRDHPMSSANQSMVVINSLNSYEYQGKTIQQTLYAETLTYQNQNQNIIFKNILISRINETRGKEEISAQKGLYLVKPEIAELWGNVRYVTGANSLRSDQLKWNMLNKTLTVQGPFIFINNNQFLNGENLNASEDLSQGSMENIKVKRK